MQPLLATVEASCEALVEDGDELEAEQRLDAGEHHAGLVQQLLDGVLQRQGLARHRAIVAGRNGSRDGATARRGAGA